MISTLAAVGPILLQTAVMSATDSAPVRALQSFSTTGLDNPTMKSLATDICPLRYRRQATISFLTLLARLLTAAGLVWEAARTQLMKEKQKVNTLHETNREGMKNLRQLRYTMFHQVVSEKMIFLSASGSNSVLLGFL